MSVTNLSAANCRLAHTLTLLQREGLIMPRCGRRLCLAVCFLPTAALLFSVAATTGHAQEKKTAPLTMERVRQALDLAKLAAENGMQDLSLPDATTAIIEQLDAVARPA